MKIRKLTREGFATFGDVITKEGARHYPINNGTTERFHDLAQIDVADADGKPLVSLFQGQPRQLPLEVTIMERHPLGSQAFIPLSKNPYLVLVAPRGEFNPHELSAFLAQAGFQEEPASSSISRIALCDDASNTQAFECIN